MGFFWNKIVWITGASSGIGFGLMKLLAEQNARLILTSSDAKKLETAMAKCRQSATHFHILPGDLSKSEQAKVLARKALEIYGQIDVLILNAGKSQRGLVSETLEKVDREIMELDYFSNVLITKEILGSMKENGGGHIAVTSSITGKFGFPMRSAYSAAKHALHGFFETLSLEERRHNIFVTIVCPGRIKTDISRNALLPDGKKHNVMDSGQENGIPAGVCAKQYLGAIEKKKREVYIGGKEIFMVYIKRFFPSLFFRIAGKIKST